MRTQDGFALAHRATHYILGRLRDATKRSPVSFYAAGGGVILLLAYTLVFYVTRDQTLTGAARRALVSVVPAAALSVLTFSTISRALLPRPPLVQAVLHLALAPTFALAWYVAIMVIYGMQQGWLISGFETRAFSPIALVWQLFQGVTVYAVVASFCYAARFAEEVRRLRDELDALSARPTPPPVAEQLLLRREGEVVPVPLREVVRVSGAGDYAEVVTRTGSHLASATLSALEAQLPPDRFVRVHRSHILALGAVTGAEPAGNGRMTIHLVAGDSVTASRAGARAFRACTL